MDSSLVAEIKSIINEQASSLYVLQWVNETKTEWSLGQIGICKNAPCFRLGFSIALSNTSLFLKETCKVNGKDLAVAIFRQWTAEEHGKPEELYIAGWVDRVRESQLDKWIATMNTKIEMHLQDRSPTPTNNLGGYGGLSGRWYLRYIRYCDPNDKQVTKVLDRAKDPADFLTALEEAKEVYLPIYEATQRPINPLNPVSNPVVCYEEPLFPTI